MGKLEGRVALVTGAARGQGRAHALCLAREGATIVGLDICKQIESVPYAMASPDDLAETASQVRDIGGTILTAQVDVRDAGALTQALDEARDQFGRLDIVVANAGIMAPGSPDSPNGEMFRDILEVNTVGVWNTVRAAVPHIKAGGRGGSIVLTSSTQGLSGRGGDGTEAITAYAASKHAVVGIMHVTVAWLARDSIRINTFHPTGVPTPMVINPEVAAWMEANPEDVAAMGSHLLPVPMIETVDAAEAILYLVSDAGRYVTGTTHRVDAGLLAG
ncbi:mycofactocin-coupled SDR family oxidoreductase [Gordonia terrae]|uniref:NAD(P)-dependent oxidoreductase n=2 Tax=Gordonia terrae TaxID=2055 RepID=A0AAD0KDN9_9ACTN|nr:mycofactocin-coupled SDR family oxidoreductase [Gordonia terrae]ANY24366.1 3-ketoacyl-ACP reductase [Gordonia terrae]AWO85112.1 NAD(P)-dependent oxidoreductase [Gordonia terrae]VTR10792.1 3-ketoacyl-ACP reductase [Clostridioides difficile]VTS58618.1 Putative short-chain type dehydrogenase/reductase MSMEG_6031 [Gordonia terrae]